MLTMWYDKIVVIIIILFRVENVIEIETHNYLIHVALYKKWQNLNKHHDKLLDIYFRIFGRPFLREGLIWDVMVCDSDGRYWKFKSDMILIQ